MQFLRPNCHDFVELLGVVRLLVLGEAVDNAIFRDFFDYRERVAVDFCGLFEDDLRGTAHWTDPDPISSCPTYERLCLDQFAVGIIRHHLYNSSRMPLRYAPLTIYLLSYSPVISFIFPTKHRWYTGGGGAGGAVKWKADSGGHLSFPNYKLFTPVVSLHAVCLLPLTYDIYSDSDFAWDQSQHYLAPGASHVAHETGIHLSHLHKNLKHLLASRRDSGAFEDQETFVLAMHGRFMHLSVGRFTKEYSAWGRKIGMPESTADGDPVASVSFTREYDLSKADDLKEAARTILALYRYIDSGEARIGTVQSGGFEFQRARKPGGPTTL
jgi:hypothetical protein